jgi:hypothetical protein
VREQSLAVVAGDRLLGLHGGVELGVGGGRHRSDKLRRTL